MTSRFPMVFLTLALVCQWAQAATNDQIQAAIDKGKAFLYSQQNRDGTWENAPQRVAGKEAFDPDGGQWGGMTCLVADALLASGDIYRDPKLAASLKFIETADIRGIYALGLRSLIWAYLPKRPSIHLSILADGNLLLTSLRTSGEGAGMYGYLAAGQGSDPSHTYDHSVSQYGVLGMWACRKRAWRSPTNSGRLSTRHGGTISLPMEAGLISPSHKADTRRGISSTAAGVASLFITDDDLCGQGLECHDNLSDTAIDRGIDWIGKHFDDLSNDPTLRSVYALYSVERVGAASGLKLFGDIDWFSSGAEYLVDHQLLSGAWDQGDGPVADTALALLFLNHGRRASDHEQTRLFVGDSNQHKRDLRGTRGCAI